MLKVSLNYKGKKFSRLVALRYIKTLPKHKGGNAVWEFECDCGTIKEIVLSRVVTGKTVSCGCYKKEIGAVANLIHGYKNTPTYSSWCGMKSRCIPGTSNSKNHGDRGIRVCKRWGTFTNFLEDMGPRPSKKHWLDRIDNNKGYSKENCQWIHKSLSARNIRKAIWFIINRKKKRLIEWCEEYGTPYALVWDRIFKQNWPIKRALTEKLHIEKRR